MNIRLLPFMEWMMMIKKSFEIAIRRFSLALAAATFMLAPTSVNAQEQAQTQASTQKPAAVVKETPVAEKAAMPVPAEAKPVNEPLYRDFKGVTIGMSIDEVRSKLGKPKEKFDDQDFFVLSDKERARVYYDAGKKARAIIATYIGDDSGAPLPVAVIGMEIESKQDGSMHKLVTYPEAGYWLSYSRTAGNDPLVMITMQKTP
jgi:hypothetical protein